MTSPCTPARPVREVTSTEQSATSPLGMPSLRTSNGFFKSSFARIKQILVLLAILMLGNFAVGPCSDKIRLCRS